MSNSLSQYYITSAVITDTLSEPLDISSVIIAVDLYENINQPFITGKIAISDDNDLFTGERFTFRGSESIELTISISLLGGGTYTITREFIMCRISSQAAANDRAGMVIVDIIEPRAYLDELKRFSKSYTGTPMDIISKILSDETLLNAPGTFIRGQTPIQEPLKVTVPYLTPLQAIEWLRKKCTTKNGSPFFMYSTVHGNEIYCRSLDDIMRTTAFNIDSPFVQSHAFLQSSVTWTLPELCTISKRSNRGDHDSLKAIRAGALAANITHTDVGTNKSSSVDYSIRDTFLSLYSDNILKETSYQNVYNHYKTFNNVRIDKLKSRYFHQIGLKTYADHNNYFDDDSRSKIKSRLQRFADNKLLEMNKITVEVPGYNFLGGYDDSTYVGVGDTAAFIFSGNNSTSDEFNQSDQVIDIDRSGTYLLSAIRHTFAGGKIITTLNGSKLTENYRELQ